MTTKKTACIITLIVITIAITIATPIAFAQGFPNVPPTNSTAPVPTNSTGSPEYLSIKIKQILSFAFLTKKYNQEGS